MLRIIPPFCENLTPIVSKLGKSIFKFHEQKYEKLLYNELIERCVETFLNLNITGEEVSLIEKHTKLRPMVRVICFPLALCLASFDKIRVASSASKNEAASYFEKLMRDRISTSLLDRGAFEHLAASTQASAASLQSAWRPNITARCKKAWR